MAELDKINSKYQNYQNVSHFPPLKKCDFPFWIKEEEKNIPLNSEIAEPMGILYILLSVNFDSNSINNVVTTIWFDGLGIIFINFWWFQACWLG